MDRPSSGGAWHHVKTPTMRFHSTPESVEAGEVTVLAVLETVLAVSAALFVAFRLNFTTHIAFGAVVAPLLMLRTPASQESGLRYFLNVVPWLLGLLDRLGESLLARAMIIPLIIALGPLVAVAGLVIRIGVTVTAAVQHPVEALTNIPGNWTRMALAVDFMHPPELVPGIENARRTLRKGIEKDAPLFSFTALIHAVTTDRSAAGLFILRPFALAVAAFGYLPALAYRWSFKATSIIYLPLIWVAHTTLEKGLDLKTWLLQIEKDKMESARRVLSAFVLGILGVKALYVFGWVGLETVVAEIPAGKLRELYLMPDVIPWWQVTAAINGALTFGLLWFASAAIPRIEKASPIWKPETVKKTLQGLTFTRGALSYYSIASVLYIFVAGSFDRLGWPPLGTKFLPFL